MANTQGSRWWRWRTLPSKHYSTTFSVVIREMFTKHLGVGYRLKRISEQNIQKLRESWACYIIYSSSRRIVINVRKQFSCVELNVIHKIYCLPNLCLHLLYSLILNSYSSNQIRINEQHPTGRLPKEINYIF